MTAAVVQRCNDLMALALERAEDQIATEVLGSACIITTLLPLVLANISPLVTLDPRVSDKKHYSCVLLWVSPFLTFRFICMFYDEGKMVILYLHTPFEGI